MSTLTETEKTFRVVERVAGAMYVTGPALAGLIASFISDFGREIEPSFFSVLAEGVLPVLLVAAFIQWAILAQRTIEADPSELTERSVASNARAFIGLFVMAEGLVLYAVATASASTFLVVTPLVAALFFLVDLMVYTRGAIEGSVERFLPKTKIGLIKAKQDKARLATAEALEARARELRTQLSDDKEVD